MQINQIHTSILTIRWPKAAWVTSAGMSLFEHFSKVPETVIMAITFVCGVCDQSFTLILCD